MADTPHTMAHFHVGRLDALGDVMNELKTSCYFASAAVVKEIFDREFVTTLTLTRGCGCEDCLKWAEEATA